MLARLRIFPAANQADAISGFAALVILVLALSPTLASATPTAEQIAACNLTLHCNVPHDYNPLPGGLGGNQQAVQSEWDQFVPVNIPRVMHFKNGFVVLYHKSCVGGTLGCPSIHWVEEGIIIDPRNVVGCECSPIVVDLGRNEFHFGDAGVGVAFDLNADGVAEQTQWVRAGEDDAFLVLDLDGNGIIDSGRELFGTATILIQTGTAASHGFSALAQYDEVALGGNRDGRISPSDAVWSRLALWLDSNADGVSSIDELSSLGERHIRSLGIQPKVRYRLDTAGNLLLLWDRAKTSDGPWIRMVDVFFAKPVTL